MFKEGLFGLNLKNSSNIKNFPLKIPNIGQNMSERCILCAFICSPGRFGDSYGRAWDSVCIWEITQEQVCESLFIGALKASHFTGSRAGVPITHKEDLYIKWQLLTKLQSCSRQGADRRAVYKHLETIIKLRIIAWIYFKYLNGE